MNLFQQIATRATITVDLTDKVAEATKAIEELSTALGGTQLDYWGRKDVAEQAAQACGPMTAAEAEAGIAAIRDWLAGGKPTTPAKLMAEVIHQKCRYAAPGDALFRLGIQAAHLTM